MCVCGELVWLAAGRRGAREMSGSRGGGRGEQPVLCNQANQRMRLECLQKKETCGETFM